MSTLYLHIGSHKTGTTSLQRVFRKHLTHREELAYIDLRRPRTKLIRSTGQGKAFQARINIEKAAEVLAAACDRSAAGVFLASDEDFFWVDDAGNVAGLADVLKRHFDEIRIICYLRRQDQLALAHRKQVVEGHAAARFYQVDVSPLPRFRPHYRRYFDYTAKLEQVWAPAFGRKNIILRLFERPRLQGNDILTDFSAAIGIALPRKARVEVNASLAGNQTYLGLELASAGVDRDTRRTIISDLPGEGRYLPCRADAEEFQAHFEGMNARLGRLWSLEGAAFAFGDDFEMYPETAALPSWNYRFVGRQLTELLDAATLERLGL